MAFKNFIEQIPGIIFLVITLSDVHAQKIELSVLKDYYRHQNNDTCLNIYHHPGDSIAQIILVRHGEPAINKKGWRNNKQAMQFIQAYDTVKVVPIKNIPVCPSSIHAKKIYHSHLQRSKNTAVQIFNDTIFNLIEMKRFREFERKIPKSLNIKLPLKVWLFFSRTLWFMGLNNRSIESFKKAKKRAKKNAAFLSKQADNKPQVFLVAHGLHNRFVAKYLQKMGWLEVCNSGRGYLSVIILAKSINKGSK